SVPQRRRIEDKTFCRIGRSSKSGYGARRGSVRGQGDWRAARAPGAVCDVHGPVAYLASPLACGCELVLRRHRAASFAAVGVLASISCVPPNIGYNEVWIDEVFRWRLQKKK